MTSEQPHPQRCETCVELDTITPPLKYRCKWNRCFVHKTDRCFCRPSRYSEASHSSAPAPEHRSIDIAEMLAAAEQAKREERERIAKQIEHNASNRKYHSYTTAMQIVESLRGEQP